VDGGDDTITALTRFACQSPILSHSHHTEPVPIRPIERHRRGVLVQPGCRDGIDRQRFERDRTKDPVEIGRKERIEDVPSPVIMERGPREPRLQQ
jgi:hypothetical protein